MHNQILQKRIYKELNDLEREPRPGITCYPKEDNISELEAYIKGPPESPYEQGLFKLSILIPDRYPFEPPQIKFLTRIYHPNIDEGGRICADILKTGEKGGWNPAINLATALLSLRQLMATPNPDDPLEADIAQEFKLDYPTFELKAKEYAQKYASEEDVLNDNHNDDDQNVVTDNKKKSPVIEEKPLDREEEQREKKPKSSLSLSKKKVSTSQSTTTPSQSSSDSNTQTSLKTRKIGLSGPVKKMSLTTPEIISPPPKTTEKVISKPSKKTNQLSKQETNVIELPKQVKVVESSPPNNYIAIKQDIPKLVKVIDSSSAESSHITIKQDVSKPTLKKRSSVVSGSTTTTTTVELENEQLLIFEKDNDGELTEKKKEIDLKKKSIKNPVINHADKSEKGIMKNWKHTAIKFDKEHFRDNKDAKDAKENDSISISSQTSSEPINLLKKEKSTFIDNTETTQVDKINNTNIASSAIDIINHAMLLSKDNIIELSDDDDEDNNNKERSIYHSLSLKRSYSNKKISLSRKRRS